MCLLDLVLCHEHCLLIYNNLTSLLCAIILHLCSTVYNKHGELPRCSGFSGRFLLTLWSQLLVFWCVCLYFLHSFDVSSQVQVLGHHVWTQEPLSLFAVYYFMFSFTVVLWFEYNYLHLTDVQCGVLGEKNNHKVIHSRCGNWLLILALSVLNWKVLCRV